MCGENRVVWLHNRICKCRSRVNAELELALLAIVRREPLQDKCTKTRACATAEGMEDKEALEARAIVSQTSDSVHHVVNLLLPNRVVASRVCHEKRSVARH